MPASSLWSPHCRQSPQNVIHYHYHLPRRICFSTPSQWRSQHLRYSWHQDRSKACCWWWLAPWRSAPLDPVSSARWLSRCGVSPAQRCTSLPHVCVSPRSAPSVSWTHAPYLLSSRWVCLSSRWAGAWGYQSSGLTRPWAAQSQTCTHPVAPSASCFH